jgi:hypothetical protein
MLTFDVIKYIFYLCDFKTQLKLRSVCKKYNTISIKQIPHVYCHSLTDKIIESYPYLERISGFYYGNFTNASVKNLKYLECIEIWHKNKIDIIKNLINAQHLRSLTILDSTPSIKWLDDTIMQFKNLTFLRLYGKYAISDESVKELHNLETLHLSYNTEITDRSVMTLTKLRKLNIYNCFGITDVSVKELHNLETLILSDNTEITDNSVMILTKLRKLEVSCFFDITDVSVSKLTNLTELNAWRNINITDSSIRAIGGTLTQLNAGHNPNITHNTLQYLTNLTFLDVTENKTVTNDTIKNMKKLKYLCHSNTDITKLFLF